MLEAIVLAGGQGTRLKGVISDIPKPMAPIGKRPFLEILFDQLIENKITNVVLSVGYKWEVIKNYFGENYKSLSIKYAIEDTPLGTGGGIKMASELINDDEFIIINGDTFFDINFSEFYDFHKQNNADLSICLKELSNFNRYGSVELNSNNKITHFKEKQPITKGYINGGIYIVKKIILSKISQKKFSFEKDIMELMINKLNILGFKANNYFIDIGIPNDYQKAINYFNKS